MGLFDQQLAEAASALAGAKVGPHEIDKVLRPCAKRIEARQLSRHDVASLGGNVLLITSARHRRGLVFLELDDAHRTVLPSETPVQLVARPRRRLRAAA